MYFIMENTVEAEIYNSLCMGRAEILTQEAQAIAFNAFQNSTAEVYADHITNISQDLSRQREVASSSRDPKKRCPICNIEFKLSALNADINKHIDACLQR
jgi:hypothetical protein